MKCGGPMKEIINSLKQEHALITEKIKEAERRIASAPEGSLRCEKKKHSFQYYYYDGKEDSKRSGKYLKKKEIAVASSLANKEYSQKLLPLLHALLNNVTTLLGIYENYKLEQIYDNLCDGRKRLITSLFPLEEETICNWLAEEYISKPFPEDNLTEFYTFNGERVRSKSEKMIADEFFRYQIPYKYEHPLNLIVWGRETTFYPDFTVFSRRTGKEIIVEHLGMMDDGNYVANAMRKLELYEKNGYLLGKNLLIFHETSESPLSIKIMQQYINEYMI